MDIVKNVCASKGQLKSVEVDNTGRGSPGIRDIFEQKPKLKAHCKKHSAFANDSVG